MKIELTTKPFPITPLSEVGCGEPFTFPGSDEIWVRFSGSLPTNGLTTVVCLNDGLSVTCPPSKPAIHQPHLKLVGELVR